MGIRKIIKEEIDDFEWVKDTPAGDVYIGATYVSAETGDVIDVIRIDGTRAFITYNGRHGQLKQIKSIEKWLDTGVWVKQGLNESNDFDWAKKAPGLDVGFEFEKRDDYIVIVYTVVGVDGHHLRVTSDKGGDFMISSEELLEKLSNGEYIRVSPLKQFSHR
jgi:hypothetical protein